MADTTISRQEHMEWCKKRALEYCDRGEFQEALLSMLSDLRKHPETENHAGGALMVSMILGGFLCRPEEIRKFIEGFN